MPLALVSPPPLTVLDLLEESVVRGPFPKSFAGLLRGAEALVRALPPDYRVEDGLGSICQLRHGAALAWAVTHFRDVHYREAEALAHALVKPEPEGEPVQRHPLDDFTYHLGLCLQGLIAHGRLGHYRAHGWLDGAGVDLDPSWFVDGNVTLFGALANAIEFADGRRITGIEGRWAGSSTPAEPVPTDTEAATGDADDADDDDDSGALAGPPVSEAVAWMRTAEATAWLDPKQPLLKKKGIIEECRLTLKITRAAAREAFEVAVPPDRQRMQGGQKK